LATTYEFARHRQVLDLGGGTGSFLLAMLRQHPHVEATLFDAPAVAALARQRLAGSSVAARLRILARILFCTCGYRIDHKTVKQLWHESPVLTPRQLELWDYHTHPDRYQARLQVIKLYYHGWDKISIHRGVSANLLYGFGHIILQSSRRDFVDACRALVEDAVPSDREASATPTA
jgi:hypothetical protein